MKAKRIRRQMQRALAHQIRLTFAKLCGLDFRTRLKVAWLLARGDPNLDKAAQR